MNITLANHISFCDGVGRAYEMVKKLAQEGKDQRIFILGSLVHNDTVAREIESLGIRKIKTLRPVKQGDTVIITAHGVSKQVMHKIEARGARVFDATCPKVIKVQRLSRFYMEKGYTVVIFGDKNHTEVKGIKGWSFDKAVIIGNVEEAQRWVYSLRDKNEPFLLVSQTTQNIGQFKEIAEFMQSQLKNLLIIDTICLATFDRQEEVRRLAEGHDVVIVIGGKESGNTRRLWEVAYTINKSSFWISDLDERTKDLLREKLSQAKSVGVISGASSPREEIEAVIQYIRETASPA